MTQWGCKTCDRISDDIDLLRAPSPFDSTDTIIGCPKCQSAEGFIEICDQPGCDKEASMGFPTTDGYRRTCSKHGMQR